MNGDPSKCLLHFLRKKSRPNVEYALKQSLEYSSNYFIKALEWGDRDTIEKIFELKLNRWDWKDEVIERVSEFGPDDLQSGLEGTVWKGNFDWGLVLAYAVHGDKPEVVEFCLSFLLRVPRDIAKLASTSTHLSPVT